MSQYCIQIAISVVAFILGCCLLGKLLDSIIRAVISHTGNWLINLTFIGVFHHELSHALLALLTGAKINSITLFRLSHKDGKLGEVKFTPRGLGITQAFQVVLTSIAPMLMGTLSLWLLLLHAIPSAVESKSVIPATVLGYLAFSIFIHMSLSSQDIKNILRKIIYLLIFLFIVFFLFNINLPQYLAGEVGTAPIKDLISAIRESVV